MSKVLKFHRLATYPTITHAISTKAHSSMKKEDGTIHHANILHFVKKAKMQGITITMQQVHGKHVEIVENDRELRIPQTDGLITKNHDLVLGVLTADCLPILFYDKDKEVIGIAHAGRKGLIKGIIPNMIKTFVSAFASDPKDIIVSIGPGIEKDCYKVGEEIIEEIKKEFPDFANIYTKKGNNYYLDLQTIAVNSLLKAGILKEHIEITDLCTKCHPELLYSYRNGDINSRFISVIGFAKKSMA